MKVLYLAGRTPWKSGKGDQVLSFNRLKSLKALGVETVLVCFHTEGVPPRQIEELKNLTSELYFVERSILRGVFSIFLGFFALIPAQVSLFKSPDYKKLVSQLLARRQFNVVHVCLSRLILNLPKTKTPVVLDHVDSMGLNWRNRSTTEKNPILKLAMLLEAKLISRFERLVSARFSGISTVSSIDSDEISKNNPLVTCETIPLGVDSQAFSPSQNTKKNFDIVFAGNLSYEPNVSAVMWFAEKVLPLVRQRKPETNVVVAGRKPANTLKEIAACNNIKILSDVPSMPDVLNAAKVVICPMISGSGMQYKVLEAMSCSIAVVATTKGIGSICAENGRDVLVADTPEKFSDSVLKLLEDASLRDALGKNARQMTIASYSWESHAQKWFDFYKSCSRPKVIADHTLLKFGVRGMARWLEDLESSLRANNAQIVTIDGSKLYPCVAKHASKAFIPIWEQILLPAYIFYHRINNPIICPFNTVPILGRLFGRWIWAIHDTIFMSKIGNAAPFRKCSYSFSKVYRAIIFSFGPTNVELILTPSDYSAKQIAQHRPELKNKIFIFANSAPKKQDATHTPPSQNIFRLFSIGGDVLSKNSEILIPTIKRLLDRNIPCHLTLLGIKSRIHREYLENLSEKLGVTKYISIVDVMSKESIRLTWLDSQVFVLTSLEEGFGIPILEAQSYGIPVICGRWSCMPEIAGDGAFFVEKNSPDMFAAAIVETIASRNLQNKLIQSGYNNLERFTNQTLEQTARGILSKLYIGDRNG